MISPGKGKVAELRLHREQKDQTKPRGARRSGNKLIFILSVVFVGYLFFSLGNQFNKLDSMQTSVDSLQSQIEELKTRNTALKQEIKQIKSDSYIEQVAREQLGLVKPGESLVIQTQPTQGGTGNVEANTAKENKKEGEAFSIPYKNIYD